MNPKKVPGTAVAEVVFNLAGHLRLEGNVNVCLAFDYSQVFFFDLVQRNGRMRVVTIAQSKEPGRWHR